MEICLLDFDILAYKYKLRPEGGAIRKVTKKLGYVL